MNTYSHARKVKDDLQALDHEASFVILLIGFDMLPLL
jgi:hypothetical protein